MKKIFIFVFSFLMIIACGGGGGGDSTGSGELAIDITDAKPMLPEGVTNFWVTFTDVLVHKPGGGWISLPLTGDLPSNTIDLLQFQSGDTTELVPPVLLESGKYTQIRLVIESAGIRFDSDLPTDLPTPVEIPSEHLKTDKNFIVEVDQSAADIVIDFDLSQSLVVTGPSETPSYKLKPVLHIVEAAEAATINGTIDDGFFGSSVAATVTVFSDGEVYTVLTVENDDSDIDVGFSIFWLVPDKSYRVEIDFNRDPSAKWCDDVDANDLPSGFDFRLNGGAPILSTQECPS